MPRGRRGTNLGRNSRRAISIRRSRLNENEEERNVRNDENRARMDRSRSVGDRLVTAAEQRRAIQRRPTRINLGNAAFVYDNAINYSECIQISIGTMDKVCQYCNALKFPGEAAGLCCMSGEVKLPNLNPPPEPLISLVSGASSESKHFLSKIQQYNSCFQMTPFGATNIVRDGFMTFKVISTISPVTICLQFEYFSSYQIQGQVYHKIGSLLPVPDSDYEFLQMYFMGNSNVEIEQRCEIGRGQNNTNNLKREIIERLQNFFHDENELVQLFKTALDRMPTDSHKVMIRADKLPTGLHPGRFNAPTVDEVAVVIIGRKRDIVLQRRSEEIENISEIHRCYDALQYPIIFRQGEDGYHFNIKMINPITG